jgi:hypothetical protein
MFLTRLRFYHNKKKIAFTHRRVYTLMVNLFQILNQFVTVFRKKFKKQALLRVKINTRISNTPFILLKIYYKRHRSFQFYPAVLSTHSFIIFFF